MTFPSNFPLSGQDWNDPGPRGILLLSAGHQAVLVQAATTSCSVGVES
jgi:hypothetical protein